MLAWPEGTDRVILDEVDSTMSEAARRAPGLLRPTWIMAHRQTNACGRRGRTWENPGGKFAATFLFRPGCAAAEAALAEAPDGDVLLIGHGAVGTLLYCHLAGLAISRAHDQPKGGGNVFAFERISRNILHPWLPMEIAP